MGENSKIEWTQHTWNPWQGCKRISDACEHCYMFRQKKWYGQNGGVIYRSSDRVFELPLRIRGPAHVFVCSWSDFFLREADPWRERAWNIIKFCKDLTFQILTKRPANIPGRLPEDWGNGYPNVWLGVSVESPAYLQRIAILQGIPAKVRFVSAEPLLRQIHWGPVFSQHRVDWLIMGCESGPGRRPTEPGWIRHARNACADYNVPFFLKQMAIDGKVVKMPALDDQVWAEMPGEKNIPPHLDRPAGGRRLKAIVGRLNEDLGTV